MKTYYSMYQNIINPETTSDIKAIITRLTIHELISQFLEFQIYALYKKYNLKEIINNMKLRHYHIKKIKI